MTVFDNKFYALLIEQITKYFVIQVELINAALQI
jgi:hypothetical protein